MKRCDHDWRPLIQPAKDPVEVFALALRRLAEFDRCAKCGRLSFFTHSRRTRRVFVTQSSQERILERATQFAAWQAKRRAGAEGSAEASS